jgi:hypothetical protein
MRGLGYFISIISVFLLAAPAWANAFKDPLLRACLIGGILASITGMGLRWLAARGEADAKQRSADS